MGSYGKIDVSEYTSQHLRAGRNAENLENAVAAWLASKPGSFSSPDACGLYDKARAKFESWLRSRDALDALDNLNAANGRDAGQTFEVALARCGYRAGVCVFDGEPKWLLILPSSIDGALDRMAAMER